MRLLTLLTLCLMTSFLAGQNTSFRAWQFHALDTAYMKKVLAIAPDYNVNAIVLSHGAIGYAMQLYEEDHHPKTINDRGRQLKEIAHIANAQSIDTYIWIHLE